MWRGMEQVRHRVWRTILLACPNTIHTSVLGVEQSLLLSLSLFRPTTPLIEIAENTGNLVLCNGLLFVRLCAVFESLEHCSKLGDGSDVRTSSGVPKMSDPAKVAFLRSSKLYRAVAYFVNVLAGDAMIEVFVASVDGAGLRCWNGWLVVTVRMMRWRI